MNDRYLAILFTKPHKIWYQRKEITRYRGYQGLLVSRTLYMYKIITVYKTKTDINQFKSYIRIWNWAHYKFIVLKYMLCTNNMGSITMVTTLHMYMCTDYLSLQYHWSHLFQYHQVPVLWLVYCTVQPTCIGYNVYIYMYVHCAYTHVHVHVYM